MLAVGAVALAPMSVVDLCWIDLCLQKMSYSSLCVNVQGLERCLCSTLLQEGLRAINKY